MKQLFYLILFVFALVACNQEKEIQIPADVLTKEQITPVLIDMHIADATLISQQLDNKESRFKGENYYEMVFEKHNTTREEFNRSIAFYARYPEDYNEIYDDVLSQLGFMLGEISKLDTLDLEE